MKMQGRAAKRSLLLRLMAASSGGGPPIPPSPPAPSLDLLSLAPEYAWSVARRLTTAYTGPLIRLKRMSDNAESDFGYDGAGLLDTAAITAWLGGAANEVVKVYAQIGTGDFVKDMVNTVPANLPVYKEASLGGRPCFETSVSKSSYLVANIPTWSPARPTVSYVMQRVSVVASACPLTLWKGSQLDYDNWGSWVLNYDPNGFTLESYRTRQVLSWPHPGDGIAFHAVKMVNDSDRHRGWLNGVPHVIPDEQQVSPLAAQYISWGGRVKPQAYNNTRQSELIMWGAALPASDRVLWEENIAAFYVTAESWRIAQWDMISLQDSGPNALHLTAYNGATLLGDSLDLERDSAQYVSVPHHAALSPGDTTYSFSLWIKLESLSNYMAILGKESLLTGKREYGLYLTNANKLEIYTFDGLNNVRGTKTHSVALTAGTWYHVYVFHDALMNQLGISLNNAAAEVQTSSPNPGKSPPGTESDFIIGERLGGTMPFDGEIKRVALFNRLLTTEERTELSTP